MKSVVFATFAAALLSGCSSWSPLAVPVNTAYNLDGTRAAEPVREARVKRPFRNANASIETTGTVAERKTEVDIERAQIAQLAKFKANSPEWWELKKKIDSEEKSQNEQMRSRLTICRGC